MANARILAAIVWVAAGAAEALPGYLTLVGPGPLRFQSPADPFLGMAALPPLLMRDPEPDTTTSAIVTATNTLAATGAAVPSPPAPAAPPPKVAPTNAPPSLVTNTTALTNAVASSTNNAPLVIETTDSQPVLTPQMLLQYFRKPAGGTNAPGRDTSVVVPLFTPPQQGPPPSSRSSYSSP